MVDTRSPSGEITVRLPGDLIAELHLLAQEKKRSVDEIVKEACLEYMEPYIWERCYKEHRKVRGEN
jgi:hypothetical protein